MLMKVRYLPVKAKACLKPNSPHSRYDGPVAWQHEIECCGLNGVQCMLMLWMTCPALPQCGVKGREASKAEHRGHILQTELALLLFFLLPVSRLLHRGVFQNQLKITRRQPFRYTSYGQMVHADSF